MGQCASRNGGGGALLGGYNGGVLSAMLGLDEAKMKLLEAKGVIAALARCLIVT